VAKSRTVPFDPKSNTFLEVGHYWPITLSDGRFAAGVVVRLSAKDDDPLVLHNSRTFIAGLLDWVGAAHPTAQSLGGSRLLDWGEAHVKTVATTGGPVLGRWNGVDSLNAIRKVGSPAGRALPVPVYRNGLRERLVKRDKALAMPVWGTWGLSYLQKVAERVLIDGKPVVL
jgi:hypothetical protein